jgi:hypothetical protein
MLPNWRINIVSLMRSQKGSLAFEQHIKGLKPPLTPEALPLKELLTNPLDI